MKMIDQFAEKEKKSRFCFECGAELRKYEQSKFCSKCRQKRALEFKKHFHELKAARAVVSYRTRQCACMDCGKPNSVDYPDQRCEECAVVHYHRMKNHTYADRYVKKWNQEHPFVYKAVKK